jgi:DNA mismatch repair protein MutS2
MDTHTLDLLEFPRVLQRLASYAASPLGRQRALAVQPSTDLAWIRAALDLTTEMTEALGARLDPPLGGIQDIRALVRRAAIDATLDATDLALVADVLRSIAAVDRWLARVNDSFPRLGSLRAGVGEFSGLVSTIESCIDARGNVLDTASRRLSGIRREVAQVEAKIQSTLRAMLRSPELRKVLRFPSYSMVGPHYVLPVAKDHRGDVPGSVHRTSASHETVYIEPLAIAEQSAELSYLRSLEQKEIRRILRSLSAQIGQVSPSLIQTLETLGELDLILARGRLSLDLRMTPPLVSETGPLILTDARHPLLEFLFRESDAGQDPATLAHDTAITQEQPQDPETGCLPPVTYAQHDQIPAADPPDRIPCASSGRRAVVPIDLTLGIAHRILVVTGPNTGGKTVALKTVGLLALMTQSGMHIPARAESQLPIFDAILADIGDEQSLEQSLSTFSSHMRRITSIVSGATARSLVLLDELGAGTDPAEGAALGRSILDELDRIGCQGIVTTHIGDLKTYALTNPVAQNAAVEFDVETLEPRYRLLVGNVGASNALQIARRLQLPEHIVARAEQYLHRDPSDHAAAFEIIERLRRDAEVAMSAAVRSQLEAERLQNALQQRLEDLSRREEQQLRLEEARAKLRPGDRVVVPRFGYDRPGRVVRIDPRRQIAQVSIGQMTWDVPVAELVPQ